VQQLQAVRALQRGAHECSRRWHRQPRLCEKRVGCAAWLPVRVQLDQVRVHLQGRQRLIPQMPAPHPAWHSQAPHADLAALDPVRRLPVQQASRRQALAQALVLAAAHAGRRASLAGSGKRSMRNMTLRKSWSD
jgi:hypothetical protein